MSYKEFYIASAFLQPAVNNDNNSKKLEPRVREVLAVGTGNRRSTAS